MSLPQQARPDGVQRVSDALQKYGHPHPPVMLAQAARTAREAAQALGVQLGQIAKSIIFRRLQDAAAVLVVASGDRRVDQKKVEAEVGALGRADAAFVKAATGFSIGGVAPLGHLQPVLTLVDEDLFRFDVVWAAAGHPHAVFQLAPADLCDMLQVLPSDVAAAPLDDMSPTARKLLSDRAASVLASASAGMSPCSGVCRMDEPSGLCLGCLRTLGEIVGWAQSPAESKMAVWHNIGERLQGVRT